MKIQVLGSGCTNCRRLHELTQQAVKELNIKGDVEYITDVSRIIEMGVMSSPVLAINGKPAMVGFVPNIEKIKKIIKDNSDRVQIKVHAMLNVSKLKIIKKVAPVVEVVNHGHILSHTIICRLANVFSVRID